MFVFVDRPASKTLKPNPTWVVFISIPRVATFVSPRQYFAAHRSMGQAVPELLHVTPDFQNERAKRIVIRKIGATELWWKMLHFTNVPRRHLRGPRANY